MTPDHIPYLRKIPDLKRVSRPSDIPVGMWWSLCQFRPYQLRVFLDTSRYRAILKSRRIGLTWYMAWEVVCTAAGLLEGHVFPYDVILISHRETDAKRFLKDCKSWILALRCDQEIAPFLETTTWSKSEIEFGQSGFCIRSETQSAGAGRGDGAHVVRDESAFYRYAEEIQSSVGPTILHDNRLRITDVSTPQPPQGTGALFHDICFSDNYSHYSRHKIDIDMAIAEGFPITVEEALQSIGNDNERFEVEFRLSFEGTAKKYISRELVEGARGIVPLERHNVFLSIDVASVIDMTAITVIRRYSNAVWWDQTFTIQDLPLLSGVKDDDVGQDLIIAALIKMFQPLGVIIDITEVKKDGKKAAAGDAATLAKRLNDMGLSTRIVGHQITKTWKDTWVPTVKAGLRSGEVGLTKAKAKYLNVSECKTMGIAKIRDDIRGDKDVSPLVEMIFEDYDFDIVKLDFLKVHKRMTPTGQETFDTTRDAEGHGDTFWSGTMGTFLSYPNAPSPAHYSSDMVAPIQGGYGDYVD